MLTKEELRNLIGAFHRAEYRINNSHDWNFLCSKSLTFFEFETQMKVGDIKIKDNHGRKWQLSKIQIDQILRNLNCLILKGQEDIN